jgi:quercetin dioxygenase-like cupin family protein
VPAAEKKSFDLPHETRYFPQRGRVDVVTVGGRDMGRATFEPGWRWAIDNQPAAGTPSCQEAHTGYLVSGRLHVRFDDGDELELASGDTFHLPAGHDAWTIGDEPCLMIDFIGITRS